MSWVLTGPGSASWVTQGSQTASYTTLGAGSPVWVQLSSVVSSDDGVDFNALLHEDYPMRMTEDRPVRLVTLYPEGTP